MIKNISKLIVGILFMLPTVLAASPALNWGDLQTTVNLGPATIGTIATKAGYVFGYEVVNSSAADAWIFLFDATESTTNISLIMKAPNLVPAGDNIVLGLNEFGGLPLEFNRALTLGISTTKNVGSFTAPDAEGFQWTLKTSPLGN